MKNAFIDPNQADLERMEKGLNYKERRMIDLVHQTLNQTSNNIQDYKNIADLMRIYNKALSNRTNDVFKNSMEASFKCYIKPDELELKISELKKNDSNSFIMMPIASNNHQFAVVFRRDDEGFNATIVNKGDRPFETQFVMYKIMGKKLPNIIKEAKWANGRLPTASVYSAFYRNSYNTIHFNVSSKNQKVGNCFIKEPENAIKFAFATRNLNGKEIASLNINERKFQPKWDYLTDAVHREFIRVIREENPKISKLLNIEYEVYSRNKKFKDLIEKSNENEYLNCLTKAFDSEGIYHGFSKKDRTAKLLSFMDLDSLKETYTKISPVIKKIVGEEHFKKLKTAYGMMWGRMNPYMGQAINRTEEGLEQIKNDFPFITKQLKHELSSDFFWKGVSIAEAGGKQAKQYLDFAEKLYPYNYHICCYKGVMNLTYGDDESVKAAIEEFNKSIMLRPDYTNAIYLRGRAYNKLGMVDKANRDFDMAKKINSDLVSKWEGMEDSRVFSSYFKEITAKKNSTNIKRVDPSAKTVSMKKLEMSF